MCVYSIHFFSARVIEKAKQKEIVKGKRKVLRKTCSVCHVLQMEEHSNANVTLDCPVYTENDDVTIATVNFWVEGVIQTAVAIPGLLGESHTENFSHIRSLAMHQRALSNKLSRRLFVLIRQRRLFPAVDSKGPSQLV